jgi:hypothetical protein
MIVNPVFSSQVKGIMSVVCHECNNILLNANVEYEAREMTAIRKLPKAQKLPALLTLVGLTGPNKISYAECTKATVTKKGTKVYCSTKHKLLPSGDNKSKIVFEKKPAHAPKKKIKRSKGKKPVLEDSEDDEDEKPTLSKKAGTKSDIFLPRAAYEMLMKIPIDQLENYIGLTRKEIGAYFMTGMRVLSPKFRANGSKDKPDKLTTCLVNIDKICRTTDRSSTELIVKLSEEVAKYEQIIREINDAKK